VEHSHLDKWLPRLSAALDGAADWHAVELTLSKGLAEEERDESRALVFAFGYRLLVPRSDDGRAVYGCAFAPMIEAGPDVTFPPRLETLPEEVVAELEEWIEIVDSTIVQSRIHDLLWELRRGVRPDLHARSAARAYLTLAAGEWHPLHRVDCATRALELGRSVRDTGLMAESAAVLVQLADTEMAGDQRRPGITLHALAPVVELNAGDRPEALAGLLDRALKRYAPDPWIEQSVRDLQAALADPDDRAEIWRAEVERWREEATNAKGLLRHVHLQHALQLGQTYGLTEVAEEILRELQTITPSDLDLKPVGFEVKFPTEEIQRFIEHIGSLPSAPEALTAFGLYGPPIRDPVQTREVLSEIAKQFPVHRLFPKQRIGPYASVIWEASTPEDHDRLELAEHETLQIEVFAHASVRVLAGIVDHFGVPPRSTLDQFFAGGAADESTHEHLADGVFRYFAGDFLGATHVLAAAIEAYLRALAAQVGVVVIRLPDGEIPGGVRALGAILASLNSRMDEAWRRYLVNALTDPLGLNLRNNIAHGLGLADSATAAAPLVHVACHARCLVQEEEPRPGR